jgi:hypothetical protein
MNGDGVLRNSIFEMPLPACLVESINDGGWVDLASSPRMEEVFGEAPVNPAFYSISTMAAVTKWWREELDEETLQCYFGTSDRHFAPGYMSKTETVMLGSLGPDLLFALNYSESSVNPSVVFLGQSDSWRKISESVCDLICALDPDLPKA